MRRQETRIASTPREDESGQRKGRQTSLVWSGLVSSKQSIAHNQLCRPRWPRRSLAARPGQLHESAPRFWSHVYVLARNLPDPGTELRKVKWTNGCVSCLFRAMSFASGIPQIVCAQPVCEKNTGRSCARLMRFYRAASSMSSCWRSCSSLYRQRQVDC